MPMMAQGGIRMRLIVRVYRLGAHNLPPLNRPRNDREAQQLYNHIRTVAWYLDAIPLLGTQLPFNTALNP